MADLNVARAAYLTAKANNASDKVILALFEAGFVESNFENLKTATDHDSLGFLQQRPSAGWPDPTNVVTATKSFVDKAKAQEASHSDAGSLAQAVQVSAFPDKYGQAEQSAKALLLRLKSDALVQKGIDSLHLPFGGGILQALLSKILKLPREAIDVAGAGASAAGNLIPGLSEVTGFFAKLASKETWIAAGYIGFGLILIIFGLFKVTGDNQLSGTTKAIAKNAASIAILKKPAGGSGATAKLIKRASAAKSARDAARGSGPNGPGSSGGSPTATGGGKTIKAGIRTAETGSIANSVPARKYWQAKNGGAS